jgi:hypothetical protein
MLGFALGCVLGSICGFLQGAWPFGVVEAIWTGVALHPILVEGSLRRAEEAERLAAHFDRERLAVN